MAKRKKKAVRKPAVIVSAVVLLVLLAVGGTLAYLTAKTGTLKNVFNPSNIEIELEETFDSGSSEKKDVKVKNTGAAAYIRARVVVTWKNNSDNVYAKAPVEGTDYTISYSNDTGWTLGSDGFYYYNAAVAAGASTQNLIDSCQLKSGATPPDGYRLSVDILAEAIQADPKTAAIEAWNVTIVSGGELTPQNP